MIFLRDFIDRGPQIRQVLEIVCPLIEEGHAQTVMGNHELNALAYHTEDPDSPGNSCTAIRRRTNTSTRRRFNSCGWSWMACGPSMPVGMSNPLT